MPVRRVLLWGLLIAVLLGLTVLTALDRWEKWRHPPLPKITEVPPFELIERDGRTVTLEDLKGTPWIAGFLFTRCRGICPTLVARMAELHRSFPVDSPVKLVAITVDPEHDTPEVLRVFAHQLGADEPPGRWLWLTGERSAVLKLVQGGFLLAVAANEDAGPEDPEPIAHSSRLVLVDGEGWVRGYYEALDRSELELLRRDLGRL